MYFLKIIYLFFIQLKIIFRYFKWDMNYYFSVSNFNRNNNYGLTRDINTQIQNNNHNINNLTQNYSGKNIDEENKNIKYSWLKREKLTQELINKKKEDYECTICLGVIKLNQNINIIFCSF